MRKEHKLHSPFSMPQALSTGRHISLNGESEGKNGGKMTDMEAVDQLVGQEGFVLWYEKTKEAGLPQTLLFVGPSGVGRKTAAFKIAGDLHEVKTLSHPDTFLFGERLLDMREQKRENPVKATLDELIRFLQLSPFSSRSKIAIIDGAGELTEVVQNGLLKTLEEPHPNVVIILIAENEQQLLPTILSRAQVVRFRALTKEELKIIVPTADDEIVELSMGSAGIARQLLNDEKLLQKTRSFRNFWLEIDSRSLEDRFRMTEKIEDRDDASLFARIGLWVCREQLHLKPKSEGADRLSLLQTVLDRINRNVNHRVALEALLLVF